MAFLRFFQFFARLRFSWVSLLLLGIVLECCGLYFQYQLRLPPCVNCVYERAFYLGFILAGFIGFLSPSFFITRVTATLVFLCASVGGTVVAFDHYAAENASGFGAACPLKASFPEFLKLDEWMPWMFSPTGACEKLDWSLLGFSMPEWILASFACGVFVSLFFLLSEFVRPKRRSGYEEFYR